MTQRLVVTFTPDGTGHCLYSELIDLRSIGALACRRASHIEFDGASQQWQVLSPDRSQVLFQHHSRSTCGAWEQETLQPV
ncbi:MAG: hypothetical protein HN742_26905 [Lentisphaerae bacterium]|jgi:hypothetical protein|nr:hypothetical protein [Lentisphaerota bacterium]MBT4820379.1 hypothetical protein [Lentisphaerota bacterium]MBT5606079.1 hypothetical protein [Lentisphaerota bacterium]MBT7057060.1 hypothetical protein [Lentisphaerota bacterium]MBT7845532.1 hypothetical protein [Lentisphaerota bacterium]